jgi:hypothetical protein
MEISERNKSKIQTPQNYEAPAIEILEVEVEKGFATSGGPGGNDSDGDPE